jgi:prolyl 4-hydroxylase
MTSTSTSYTVSNKWMCIIDDILSPTECADFIQLLDNPDELELVDHGYAVYERNILHSPNWATTIYNRIISHLPEKIKHNIYVNDYFRFSKYTPGQRFGLHQDKVNRDKNGSKAIMTVNIFLNDNFEGGETCFYENEDSLQPTVRAVPKAGRGAIFENQIWHSGNVVHNGYKYLIRTDVMMKPINTHAMRNDATPILIFNS